MHVSPADPDDEASSLKMDADGVRVARLGARLMVVPKLLLCGSNCRSEYTTPKRPLAPSTRRLSSTGGVALCDCIVAPSPKRQEPCKRYLIRYVHFHARHTTTCKPEFRRSTKSMETPVSRSRASHLPRSHREALAFTTGSALCRRRTSGKTPSHQTRSPRTSLQPRSHGTER